MRGNMIKKRKGYFLNFISLLIITLILFKSSLSLAVSYGIESWVQKNDQPIGYVTISLEKFSLNQGYLIEPRELPFYEGDTGSVLVDRLLGSDNYKNTGTVKDSFYLSRVYDSTMEEVNFPKHIIENSKDLSTTRSDEWLGEFDYYGMSGWMYSVNGWFPNYGFSQYIPKDGDVIRIQFTVSGYGADIGANNEEWGQPDFINFADKNMLTKLVGKFNSSDIKSKLLEKEEIKKAYYKAMETLIKIDSTESEVEKTQKNMLDVLSKYLKLGDSFSLNEVDNSKKDIVNKNKFTDIKDYKWAKDSIYYLVENNIIKGKTSSLFDPSADIKKGDFALILARALKLDLNFIGDDYLKDVKKDDYYYKAVNSVIKYDLMKDVDGYFNPKLPITKEEMIEILSRIVSDKNEELVNYPILEGYIGNKLEGKPSRVTRVEAAVIIKEILDLN